MATFQNKYRIESARLESWDYSWPGWYYVTISTRDKTSCFGGVRNNLVCRSPLGDIAPNYWLEIPKHHANAEHDDFIVMPNHVHGIIILDGMQVGARPKDHRRDVQLNVSTNQTTRQENATMANLSPCSGSLSVIVRTFKGAVTTWARDNGFGGFAWQERFHDHIIRNAADLHRIRTYVRNNPLKWALDEENPDNIH